MLLSSSLRSSPGDPVQLVLVPLQTLAENLERGELQSDVHPALVAPATSVQSVPGLPEAFAPPLPKHHAPAFPQTPWHLPASQQ
ncbi:hypothetical protein D3C75_1298860 [compost metagenome]